MIKIINVTKKYPNGVKAIDNISIDINKGDIFGVIGLSGAGKSSLIRCVNRLEEITSGKIEVDGRDISKLNKKELIALRKDIGMIFQSFNLFERRTVYQNISFPLILAKINKSQIDMRVNEMLELVGLKDKKNSYPFELSGGQKQRVAIARALINNPKILLCDEPTSALDPITSSNLLDLLVNLKDELGFTTLIISHDMDVVKKICNRLAVLEKGRLKDYANTVDIFSKPSIYIKEDMNTLPKGVADGQIKMWLVFNDKSSREAVISKLIRKFDLDVNILMGNIEYVSSKAIGKLLVCIDNKYSNIRGIIDFLNSENVEVEVVESE